MPRAKQPQEPSGDLLWGAKAIAEHIRRSKRQTYYLIENELIPFKRVGPKTIVGSRSQLDAHLKETTT